MMRNLQLHKKVNGYDMDVVKMYTLTTGNIRTDIQCEPGGLMEKAEYRPWNTLVC